MTASQRLPKDPIERSASLVLRSLPGTRERLPSCLPPEAAEVILQARNVRAEMYASMEDLSDRCRSLSEEMEEVGVVMHIVDDADSDSMVNHIVETRRTLATAAEVAPAEVERAERIVDEISVIPLAAGGRSR